MKTYLALGLLSSLLLTSCWVDWNDAKEKRIGELEKQVVEMKKEKDDDLFKKKQECVKYKDEMLEFAKWYHSDVYELEEIFYSPIKNWCYFIAKEWFSERLLFDYMNQKVIAWGWFSKRCYDIVDKKIKDNCELKEDNADVDYDRILKELKWE